MIHNQATMEDVVRMAHNTPTHTYGFKLAAADTLARLNPSCCGPCACPPGPTGSDQAIDKGGEGWNLNRLTPPSSSTRSCCS